MTKPSSPAITKDVAPKFTLNKSNKRLLIVLAAVIVIIGGFFAYKYLVVKPADEKAQTQLTTALTLISQAQQAESQNLQVQAMPDSSLTQALQAQGMLVGLSADSVNIVVKQYREQQQAQVTSAYNAVLKGSGKFPGLIKLADGSGNAANIATYLAGIAYYHINDYKKAISYLEDFSPKGDAGVSAMALYALANCYACDKQIDKAIASFKDAADEADNESLSPLCLIEAGKLLESQNKKADAHEIYEQVKRDYPRFGLTQGGMTTSEIDKYIERTK